jgi:hypothetical protein
MKNKISKKCIDKKRSMTRIPISHLGLRKNQHKFPVINWQKALYKSRSDSSLANAASKKARTSKVICSKNQKSQKLVKLSKT